MARTGVEVLRFPINERDLEGVRWFHRTLTRTALNRAYWKAGIAIFLSGLLIWANVTRHIIRSEGDSNYPFYHDGDIRVFLPLPSRPGNLVSADVGEECRVAKWLREDGGLYSSNLSGATYEPEEVVRIVGRQVACIPTHYILGSPPDVEDIHWSPDGRRLAYIAVGKVHLRRGRKSRPFPEGDYLSVNWVGNDSLLAMDLYGSYHLLGLSGEELPIKTIAMAVGTLEVENVDRDSEKATWGTRSWYKSAECHRWLDRAKTLLWMSYVIPEGNRSRWVSYIYDTRTEEFTQSIEGVSEIFPSGVVDRFVACRRAGDVVYVLYDGNRTQELGLERVFGWSQDGKKLAWAVGGYIRTRVWR